MFKVFPLTNGKWLVAMVTSLLFVRIAECYEQSNAEQICLDLNMNHSCPLVFPNLMEVNNGGISQETP